MGDFSQLSIYNMQAKSYGQALIGMEREEVEEGE